MSNESGIIYIFSNPAMPGIVKIGMTTRDNIDDRLKELFNTSVPVPFECEYACKVQDYRKVEEALHVAFGPNRINPQREFFKIDPEQAIAILRLLSIEDITPEVVKESKNDLNPIDIEAGNKLKQQRRPPLNFKEMDIPVGSILTFIRDGIEVKVIGDKKINYQNRELSLTQVTKEILGLDYAVQPTRYWFYNGINLSEIYENTYSNEEA